MIAGFEAFMREGGEQARSVMRLRQRKHHDTYEKGEPGRVLDRSVGCQLNCQAQAVFALSPVDCREGYPLTV